MIEVGSAPGLTNLLQVPTGVTTIFAGSAGPGIYYVRVRASNACGTSGVSNEVIVVVSP